MSQCRAQASLVLMPSRGCEGGLGGWGGSGTSQELAAGSVFTC